MRQTIEQKQAAKFEKFLATLTKESEVFGLLGKGFPHSFYKVYVRSEPGKKWWRIEVRGATPEAYDPIRREEKLAVKKRTAVIWSPIADMLHYDHMSGETLDRLYEYVTDLVGAPRCHVVAVAGPQLAK